MAYRRRYYWPDFQLNVWTILSLAASATCLGINVWFLTVQSQLELGVPWVISYMVTISSLGIFFIFLILVLAARRFLLPGIVAVGSFILFVLWLAGLIGTSLQLFSSSGNISSNCQTYVSGDQSHGNNLETLAWLAQNSICNCWKTCFAFELINVILYFWLDVMAYQVNKDVFY